MPDLKHLEKIGYQVNQNDISFEEGKSYQDVRYFFRPTQTATSEEEVKLKPHGGSKGSRGSNEAMMMAKRKKSGTNYIMPLNKLQESWNTLIYDVERNEEINLECCARVLIVDDEPFNFLGLQSLLKMLDILSDTAIGGIQALEKMTFFKKRPRSTCGHRGYKYIFTDINMP